MMNNDSFAKVANSIDLDEIKSCLNNGYYMSFGLAPKATRKNPKWQLELHKDKRVSNKVNEAQAYIVFTTTQPAVLYQMAVQFDQPFIVVPIPDTEECPSSE